MQQLWRFWIDRGGTFTDVFALSPKGVCHSLKLLSQDCYQDATTEAVKRFGIQEDLGCFELKIGTTLATNALLERKLPPTALLTTQGFADAGVIGTQARPDIFALNIQKPAPLYQTVVEIEERVTRDGTILRPLDLGKVRVQLATLKEEGIKALAIAFMHGYRYPQHEEKVATLARDSGFEHISLSHQVSPMVKLIPRADTALANACLSPIIEEYIAELRQNLGQKHRFYFMQSGGGLVKDQLFQGKDAIMSGPAGGIVAAVKLAEPLGYKKLISFDMGGTSSDVAHYAGRFERRWENQIAGLRLFTPMLDIHTVAAGGGSICRFHDGRYQCGPESGGADPGPACYRKGGPLCLTDCNVVLGRIRENFFPKLFGTKGNQAIDVGASEAALRAVIDDISAHMGVRPSLEEAAEGFLTVAIEKMALAIRKISLERGHDLRDYVLVCFGGAGGQHACHIAEILGIRKIMVHPASGMLSALGIGLADLSVLKRKTIGEILDQENYRKAEKKLDQLSAEAINALEKQYGEGDFHLTKTVFLSYHEIEGVFEVAWQSQDQLKQACKALYIKHYGFEVEGRAVMIDSVSVEIMRPGFSLPENMFIPQTTSKPDPEDFASCFMRGESRTIPIYNRAKMPIGFTLKDPAIIHEEGATTILEVGWRVEIAANASMVLTHHTPIKNRHEVLEEEAPDPVFLELFNNRIMSIAEGMGVVLQKTARSINIRERLDFSCAIFDAQGNLIANAPHVPVHLGSMGESVRATLKKFPQMEKGDVFIVNSPWEGGTHLPDITVITPIFAPEEDVLFFTAARAHHADIGGITPGSMPPFSKHIDEEGVLIEAQYLARKAVLAEKRLLAILKEARFPARNPEENLADLQAQMAANHNGMKALLKMNKAFTTKKVRAYMGHIQDNAEHAVKRVLRGLKNGTFTYKMDNGCQITVSIQIDFEKSTARIDFSGTSPQQKNNNFNAPSAICRAAVLYVLRTLIKENIPLNEGCLRPIEIIIPEGSMLAPQYPMAVAAGNVETSQAIVDTLYGALGIMAASQGTMNNITFGNEKYQYYETLCGGAGGGRGFDGVDAIHTHMTNSRLSDPEILENNYPVRLESFSIRKNSGGEGRWKGGNGVKRVLYFLEAMTLSIISNRRDIAPYGVKGGADGGKGRNKAVISGKEISLHSCDQRHFEKGDVFIIETPGGGGYGKK